MGILHLLRSVLSDPKSIGFGAGDLVELVWAVLLVVMVCSWRPLFKTGIMPALRALARRTVWCMLTLAALPAALRLALLPNHPAPSPDIYDEFAHLLTADTLLHGRLANPTHPMHRFFETFFVLQEPTYSSIYPLGQGAALALGRALFGHPWAGVILSTSAFCALCYWMLLAWTTPEWALLGGLLAVAEFGPLNYWMNSYWGGAVPALAGCLVFGALPRLAPSPSPVAPDYRAGPAALLGIGLTIHWLTRPFETIFLWLGAGLYFLPMLASICEWREWRTWPWKCILRVKAIVVLAIVPAVAITLLHDKRVTGRWLELPETLSMEQYGVPAALTFQSPAVPQRALTPEQQLDYKMQLGFGPPGGETLRTFLERLEYRIRFYRFFYLTPLYLALPFFFPALREWRFLWVALTLLVFSLGINLFPAYQHHYLGAVTCLFVLVSVTALRRLSELGAAGAGRDVARLLAIACAAQFIFWYSVHVFDNDEFALALRPYETWDVINHRNPERRTAVNRQLAQAPGRQLVFVRYAYPRHAFQEEWVYNAADIDGSPVVWARDLEPEEDEKLRRYYPDRTAWLLEPDYRPARLGKYEPPPPPEPEKPAQPAPKMRFLPIPEAK
jgi:hypothetical protein